MSDKLPMAVWEGIFTVFGVPLKCAVLSTGERVIEAESLEAFFAAMGNLDAIDAEVVKSEVAEFAKWRLGR